MPTVPHYNINSTAETSINSAKKRITGLSKVQTNELTESVPGNQMTEDIVDDALYKITHKINFDIIVELKKLKSYLQIANVDEKGRDPASLREFVSSSAKIEPNVKEILSVLKKLYKGNSYNLASLGVFTDFLTAVDEALALVKEIKPISEEFERRVLRDNPELSGMLKDMDEINYKEGYITGAVQFGKTHWNELVALATDLQSNRPVSRYTYNRILDGAVGNTGFRPSSMTGGNWLNDIASGFEVMTTGLDKHIKGMWSDPKYRKSVDDAWERNVWQNIDPSKVITRMINNPSPPVNLEFHNPFTKEGQDALGKEMNEWGKKTEKWITGTISEAIDDYDKEGRGFSLDNLILGPWTNTEVKARERAAAARKRLFGKGYAIDDYDKKGGRFTTSKLFFGPSTEDIKWMGKLIGKGLNPQETRQLNQLRELMKDIDPNTPSKTIRRKIAQLEAKERGTSGESSELSVAESNELARGIIENIAARVPAEQRSEKSTKAQKAQATKNMKRLAEALRKSGVEKQRIIAATKNTQDALIDALDDYENTILLQPELKGLSGASLQDIAAQLFLGAYGDIEGEMMREIAQEALDESRAPIPEEEEYPVVAYQDDDLADIDYDDYDDDGDDDMMTPEPTPRPTPRPTPAPSEYEPSESGPSESGPSELSEPYFDPNDVAALADMMTAEDYWTVLPEDSAGGPTIELDEETRREAFVFVGELLRQIKANEDDARAIEARNKKSKLFKYAKEIINLMPSKVRTITKLMTSIQEATKAMMDSFNTRRKQYALSDAGIEERVRQGGSMYDRSFNENNMKLYNSSGLPKYI
jgi:uncharacterized protein YlaN (UPF0358 family)